MIDKETAEWIIKANSDLKIIEHELNLPEEEIVKDAVCFHCQQAVEKYLKAFLIHHKVKPKRTHDIGHLLDQCANIDKDFASFEIKELSIFGVDIRYPDDFYIPTIEEVKFYYNLAKQIKISVNSKLKTKE